MSSFSAMTAQAASSRVVEDSFIEEESNVSEELESISVDLDSLSELEITESAARNYYANIVFGTDQDVDHSKLNDALATFQPKNQKIEEIAPQVLSRIIAVDGIVTDNYALFTKTFSNNSFLFIHIKDDNVKCCNCYDDENHEINSGSFLNYYANDNEMDLYRLKCFDQRGWYEILYYPGLEKTYVWKNVGDHTEYYEKDISSENMEELFNQLNSLFISASTTSFETNSFFSTPEVDYSFGKAYH